MKPTRLNLFIAFILAWFAMCFGCTSTRHTTTSSIVVHDTTTVHDTVTKYHDREKTVIKYVHDTVLTFPALSVSKTFSPVDLQPWFNTNGVKVPHSFTTANGKLSAKVSVDTGGYVDVECNMDSMYTVVALLTQENTTLKDSIEHINRSTTVKNNSTAVSYAEVWVKTKGWLSRNYWWLIAVALVFVIGQIYVHVKRSFNRPIP